MPLLTFAPPWCTVLVISLYTFMTGKYVFYERPFLIHKINIAEVLRSLVEILFKVMMFLDPFRIIEFATLDLSIIKD